MNRILCLLFPRKKKRVEYNTETLKQKNNRVNTLRKKMV